jgi:hypothetical protein
MIRAPQLLPIGLALLVAGCAAPVSKPTGPAPISEKAGNMREAGLERVIGKSARDLTQLFGDADLDSREGLARRLQFVGPACVLDAYLAASRAGDEPVVTYVDARLPNGEDIDRASCVAALVRRDAAP